MQDAYSADRGSPQPPIPNTTSPRTQKNYLRQQRLLLILRASTRKLPVRAGGSQEVMDGAGHGNVYVSWPCPSSSAGSQTQPARNSASVLLQGWSSRGSGTGNSPIGVFDPRDMSQLLHGLTGCARETGVFPCWDWIMYCTLVQLREGARRMHVTREGGLEQHEQHAVVSLQCCCRHTRGFILSAPGYMMLTSPQNVWRFLSTHK